MHQIRAHLAYVGAPIAGDALYGGAPIAGLAEPEGFFLHAARIALPLGGQTIVAEAPEPERFARARAACGL
jgi:23S rRNA pseudouridine1911/1915/1917 synthase